MARDEGPPTSHRRKDSGQLWAFRGMHKRTGRGSITTMRAVVNVEEIHGRTAWWSLSCRTRRTR